MLDPFIQKQQVLQMPSYPQGGFSCPSANYRSNEGLQLRPFIHTKCELQVHGAAVNRLGHLCVTIVAFVQQIKQDTMHKHLMTTFPSLSFLHADIHSHQYASYVSLTHTHTHEHFHTLSLHSTHQTHSCTQSLTHTETHTHTHTHIHTLILISKG